jgi:prepilin-type N-terminal cleavage/methylation domain-containing protein
MNTPRKLKSVVGFTIIEVLVVVFIIGILVSIVTMALFNVWDRTDIVRSTNNLRSLNSAINLYTSDNQGRYPGPVWYNVNNEINRQDLAGYVTLTLRIAPYLDLPEWRDMGRNTFHVAAAFCPRRERIQPGEIAHYARHAQSANSPFGGRDGADGDMNEPMTVFNVEQRLQRSKPEIMAIRERPLPAPQLPHRNGQLVLFLDGNVQLLPTRQEPR